MNVYVTPGASGNVFGSQLGSKPMVRCSGDVMTLTAHGREYTHILVDRGENNYISSEGKV